jgi:predicted nucleic acid-binding protein
VVLVDTNVLLDVVEEDPTWAAWSQRQLEALAASRPLVINPVIYAELSIAYLRIEELERVIGRMELRYEELPRSALFLAGKALADYRRRGGSRGSVLPDFFIGAHAAVIGASLLTRSTARYRAYFPTVELLSPAAH